MGNIRKPQGQTLRVFTAFLCVGGFGEICVESASLSFVFLMSCLLGQDFSPVLRCPFFIFLTGFPLFYLAPATRENTKTWRGVTVLQAPEQVYIYRP